MLQPALVDNTQEVKTLLSQEKDGVIQSIYMSKIIQGIDPKCGMLLKRETLDQEGF